MLTKTQTKSTSPGKCIKFGYRYHLLLCLTQSPLLHYHFHPAPEYPLFLMETVFSQTM